MLRYAFFVTILVLAVVFFVSKKQNYDLAMHMWKNEYRAAFERGCVEGASPQELESRSKYCVCLSTQVSESNALEHFESTQPKEKLAAFKFADEKAIEYLRSEQGLELLSKCRNLMNRLPSNDSN